MLNNFLDALPLKTLPMDSVKSLVVRRLDFFSAHRLLQALCLLSFFLSFLSELKSSAAWSRPRSSLIFSHPYKSPYLSITWQGKWQVYIAAKTMVSAAFDKEWQQIVWNDWIPQHSLCYDEMAAKYDLKFVYFYKTVLAEWALTCSKNEFNPMTNAECLSIVLL